MALLDDDGHPTLDESGPSVPRDAVVARLNRARAAETTVELDQRRLDTVDLIVQGATLRQVAERHGISMHEARSDFQTAVKMLNAEAAQRVHDLREEVTARQRTLILANMSKARAGDIKAAAIVQRADQLLIEMWGLRYVRPEEPELPRDPTITAALSVYLEKVAESMPRVPALT